MRSASAPILRAAALLLAAASPSPRADTSEPGEPGEPHALEDVVVTAQKRPEDAQQVGIALSVIEGETLATRAIRRVEDLQHATPSLEVEPAFGSQQSQFRLRGVGYLDYMTNNSAPVAVSVDGVAYAFPVQTGGLLFDLERVEVLRGPQGTLRGRNTTGGAIDFVTAAPTRETGLGFDARHGSDDAFELEAHASGALDAGGALRGRVAFATARGGAWQRHRTTGETLGDADVAALRTRLDWDASDRLAFELRASLARDRSDSRGLRLIAPFSPAGGEPPLPPDRDRRATGWGLRPAFAASVGLAPDAKPGRDNESSGASLTAIVDFDRARLTSITALDRLDRREYGDYDASEYADSDQFFDSAIESRSQELRLQSQSTEPLGLTLGVHASDDTLDERSHVDLTARLGGILLTEYRQHGDTLGAFGQLDWRFAPDYTARIGLRRDRERRELADFFTRFVDPPIVFAGPEHRALEHSGTSGRLALEYAPDDATLWYASASRGFKSGGFTAHNTADPRALEPFRPETLVAWEAGFKLELGGTLRLNGAVYHYDYRDQQVLSAIFEPRSQSLTGFFVNAPRSRIDGAELELAWRPRDDVVLTQFAGWKTGEYTDSFVTYDPVASLAAGENVFRDYEGEALDFPELSYGGTLAKSFALARGTLTADLGYAYRDTYPQRLLLGPGFEVESYWLVHAGLEYAPHGSRWRYGAYARNALDEGYDLTRNYFLPGTEVAASGPPRSVGLRVSYGF